MKLFIITTLSQDEDSLSRDANLTDLIAEKKRLSKFYFDQGFGTDASNHLGNLRGPDKEKYPDQQQFKDRITQIIKPLGIELHIDIFKFIKRVNDSDVFIYNKFYGDRSDDQLYIKFIELLATDVIGIAKPEKNVELNLVLHQGDNINLAPANQKLASSNPIFLALKDKKIGDHDVTFNIYTFSHDGSGIHGAVIKNNNFFEGIDSSQKSDFLYQNLEDLTNQNYFPLRDDKLPPTLKLEDGIFISIINVQRPNAIIKEYISQLADWQLNGCMPKSKRMTPDFENIKPVLTVCEHNLESFTTDRRINYLDSSIWLRYVAKKDEETIEQAIENAKDQIKLQVKHGLYKTDNAKEYFEFYARMAKNSYLGKFGPDHPKNVSPFVFHSEQKMALASAELFDKLKAYKKKLKWRFLLVDDHAKTGDPFSSKEEIIMHALSGNFQFQATDFDSNNFVIEMDYATSIHEAKEKIKSRRYDIILLDYLLGKKPSRNISSDEREYGYQLLNDIKEIYNDAPQGKGDWKGVKGIYEKFWFLFISAFPNAVSERLVEQGMAYNTDYWQIGRGACPRNTPELFRYNLLNFMYRQIEVITQLPNVSLIDENAPTPVTPGELLKTIYQPAAAVGYSRTTRECAGAYFDDLLKMKANYSILKKDYDFRSDPGIENGSLLVHSLFPDIKIYSESFWEHLMHMVYLTAYGIIRQWPELWEEFLFVRSKLDGDTNQLIESYIIGLKEGKIK